MAAAGHDVVFIARGTHRDAIRREDQRQAGFVINLGPFSRA